MSKESRQRIADLEAEVAELREFNTNNRAQMKAHEKILAAIYGEHPPMVVKPLRGVALELRCRRCQTDEHHTWANDNHVPWPCPTLASFVSYAVYTPAEEGAEDGEQP
ncbi:hypothetical protein [Nocardia asiatica]|uniref:hypothetical protein n=1 Tax=Nocardia asiatica TaxID=209252 RepID=UPI0002F2B84C|nr:hypothetical protein [Nocardia asiatica]